MLHATAGTAFGASILGTEIGIAGGAGVVGAAAPAVVIGAATYRAIKAAPKIGRGARRFGHDFMAGFRESKSP